MATTSGSVSREYPITNVEIQAGRCVMTALSVALLLIRLDCPLQYLISLTALLLKHLRLHASGLAEGTLKIGAAGFGVDASLSNFLDEFSGEIAGGTANSIFSILGDGAEQILSGANTFLGQVQISDGATLTINSEQALGNVDEILFWDSLSSPNVLKIVGNSTFPSSHSVRGYFRIILIFVSKMGWRYLRGLMLMNTHF